PATWPPIPNPVLPRRLATVASSPGGRALHWLAVPTGGDVPAGRRAPKRNGFAWCASRLGRRRVTAFYPARFERFAYVESIPQYTPHRRHFTGHLRRLQVSLSAAKVGARVGAAMKGPVPVESASAFIDEKIKELGDWRGKMLAKVREIIHEADPEIVEEWKWVKPTSPGTPVFSHGGIVCTGETYKNVVKMTFAKGAALKDPSGLFNSSLEGNVRRAIDIHKGDKIDESALKDLIRAAVAVNLKGTNKPKPKPKPRRASSKRAD